jgi:Protein of unknown function (DUF2934)
MSRTAATPSPARSTQSSGPATAKQSARLAADQATTAVPPPPSPTATEDDIRLLAYLKWEADSKPDGHDLFFWCEAERELLHGA